MGDRDPDFSKLVHQILVVEKLRPMREVAAALRLPYATFYSRVNGRVAFTPDEVNRLLRCVPDIRLADCLLGHTDFMAVGRPAASDPDLGKNAIDTAIDSAEQILMIVKAITKATAENRLDGERSRRIEEKIEGVQRSLETLRAALPFLSAHPERIKERFAAL